MTAITTTAATLALVLLTAGADPAFALSPRATVALAERIPDALPPAARWNPRWGAAAREAVSVRLRLEDERPENAFPWHRWHVEAFEREPGAATSEGRSAILGLAATRLPLVAEALRAAFVEGDDGAIALAIAELAMNAADLADPFQVTGFDRDEVETARARFSDLFDSIELEGLDRPRDPDRPAVSLDDVESSAVRAEGTRLAARSALAREAVEAAVLAGDDQALRSIRLDRLRDSLALARAVARASWRAAGAPMVGASASAAQTLRVAPNPVGPRTMLSFTLPRAAEARLELYDAVGRRRWSRSLGERAAGPQGAAFAPDVFASLPPGLYLVAVTAGDFRASARLVHFR